MQRHDLSIRKLQLAVLVLLCAAWLPAQNASENSHPVDVLVTITGHGNLTLQDLTAEVDGHVVPIKRLRAAKGDPLVFAVLLDTSGSTLMTTSSWCPRL